MIFSLPSLVNVLALLFLVFFIYSVLGVFLYSGIVRGDILGDFANFSNFGNAMILLFRCSTGEDWHIIMYDTMRVEPDCVEGETCGS
mmetsp:Transcript_24520/g.21693  ORF Transcript_24520/g.21693 Transcript_24520/m.21693 type:complete len:87 (-) Transcript_24520:213-473(-)